MNEMYDMGIVTHYYGVIGILVVILGNVWMLHKASSLPTYQRKMSLFTPLASVFLGGVIFTGIVMMAAKHLTFSIENILMIFFSVCIILLEVLRLQKLKYLNPHDDESFPLYKTRAFQILFTEFGATLSMSIWMWL
ncbi:hypothetical protein JHD48_00350 [Sulfurimonas sp. SAG-AH-194-I05]|nr:hypothetical protein [Sulfurimonas sp. SAG-AH-194-I05]MDF1874176.1 hypothetical protein [Sulfurimonas sp. SAG-AH-194-I05]